MLYNRFHARSGNKSKYGVRNDEEGKRKRTVNGILCASEGEADRYKELLFLESVGRVQNLMFHKKKFKLEVNGYPICTYTPDFLYYDVDEKGVVSEIQTVEDFKGAITREFKRTWALMNALYRDKYNLLLTGAKR